ncbi:hypothetical protein C2869_14345 [Saccharobesus litoralis]|uniref:ABC3 transporter permease C-terminal domain-containing protein n=1 Tax=Saccharobesus litoralis TaxID=2172099 RepID=A0A2S0VTK9_9ALTE|nr:FtsX-like permease family protein [Saccharobesus litoralis]AWB67545.1 hypothetical protein C2869_14345 [Saccharobesus litoralis]
MLINLSVRLLSHELKRNELTIMLLAIVLAVASVFSLSAFSEKLQKGVHEKSAQFLAADAVLFSSRPLNKEWQSYASQTLHTSDQIRFRTMLFFEDEMLLGDVKAVDDAYPLKGSIKLKSSPYGKDTVTQLKIKPGEVWLAPKFFNSLGIKIGDTIDIGEAQFLVTQIIGATPDQSFSPFTSGAEILLHIDDVPKTQVIQPGSRIAYRLSLAVKALTQEEADTKKVISQFEDWLFPKMNDDLHGWRTVYDDSSPVGNSVARATRFFQLASLISIILAATAVGVAATQYAKRHYDAVAILKTLGASKKQIIQIFSIHLFLLIVAGLLIGLLAGWAAQQGVLWLVAEQLPADIANVAVSLRPFVLAALTGFICAGLFSLVPLLELFGTPPLRVIRRQLTGKSMSRWLGYGISAVTIFVLMWLYSSDLRLSAILFVSSLAVVALLAGLSQLSFWSSRKVGSQANSAFKLAVARIYRNAKNNSLQLISFAIAVQLFLLVLVLRSDLIAQWQNSLKDGTPNYFAVNIPHHKADNFQADFKQHDLSITDIYPITRGRLVAINDERLADEVTKEKKSKAEEGQQRSIGRELSLTSHSVLPTENVVTQGVWWPENPEKNQVSVEAKLAERMKINLHDKLTFNVTGTEFTVTVTSIRTVKWETMTPNFFMIFSDDVLQTFAATYIASFYIQDEQSQALANIMSNYSTTSLIDIQAILSRVRDIANQASMAVEFIFILVLGAGLLVLFAQVQASMADRNQEVQVLKLLGAKGRLIRSSIVYEFVLLGALAGLFAALSMEGALWAVQTFVFKMPWQPHWQYWLIAPILSGVVLAVFGAMTCLRLLKQTVRQGAESFS